MGRLLEKSVIPGAFVITIAAVFYFADPFGWKVDEVPYIETSDISISRIKEELHSHGMKYRDYKDEFEVDGTMKRYIYTQGDAVYCISKKEDGTYTWTKE